MKEQTVPQLKSRFLVVKCECNNEQIVYSNSSIEVKCEVCGKVLAKPTGGKSKILGEVLQVLD